MDVVIYARYSSHSQTEQSIEGQIKVCKEFAKKNNYSIVGEYIDRALTGTTDNRPQFLQMIEDSNKHFFNGVLVYQLDRFARNRYDSAVYKNKLKKNNVRVFSAKENISDDASGVLMESLLEGMAEYYSVELSQKVKRGMEINAEKFLYNGGIIPLGLKIDENKKYQIDEEKAYYVKEVFNKYLAGESMKDISIYLKSIGIKSSMGNNFTPTGVRCLLTNKKYITIYSYKDVETPNIIPRIIDDETFYKVQEKLNLNKRAPARNKAKVEYILTTKLFCGHCKEMMVGISGTSRTQKIYNYYSCNGIRKKICNKKNVQKDYIEDIVVNEARKILTDKNIKRIAKDYIEYIYTTKNNNEVDRLNKIIEQNNKEKQNLVESLAICELDNVRKEIFTKIKEIQDNITEIEKQLNIETKQMQTVTELEIEFFLTELRNGDINDIRYRKLLVDILINRIYLYDDNMTIIFNIQKKQKNMKIPSIDEIESSFLDKNAPPRPTKNRVFVKIPYFYFGSICCPAEPTIFLFFIIKS